MVATTPLKTMVLGQSLVVTGLIQGTEIKFRLQDGITLYDSEPSPCARRVRMTLIEKAVSWNKVEVDLMTVEQKTPEYLKINPNGKVPALTVQNVKGVPDCSLYESNVITEFLDSVLPGIQLYPDDPWEKAQARQWQEWEIGLTDDFVPVMYSNTFGFVLRAIHASGEALLQDKNVPKQVTEKYKKLYDGTYLTQAEIEEKAMACYRNLLTLEKGLENKDFLVGNRFTIADLSVCPRVQMFYMMGLPIGKEQFPNICRYLDNLYYRPCFRQSQSRGYHIMALAMTYLSSLIVAIGNWRSGEKHVQFDGTTVLDRVLASQDMSLKDDLQLLPTSEEFLVYNYPTSSECLQMKILLREKGASFTSTPCDFMDLIGRPNGSGGLFRLQHKDRLITGCRTILDYVNSVSDGKSLYPTDPKLKAECQCWQAWDQTMNWLEFSILFEKQVISQKLHERFTVNTVDELLALKDDIKYSTKNHHIMEIYMTRVTEDSPVFQHLSEYSDLIKTEEEKQKTEELYHELLISRLQHLEKSLQDREYLVGDEVTLADVAIYCRLLFFPLIGLHITQEDYPGVRAWMDRLKQREAFKEETLHFEKTMGKYKPPE
ncbi:uncharacterized protein [Ptychodera flava]|uniref:uncharacterized protein isoform X2 n=1 Tax=Ptychodera flava TaxID=63121 RepID=UPI00396A3C88